MRIVPVLSFTWRSAKSNDPRCGYVEPSSQHKLDPQSFLVRSRTCFRGQAFSESEILRLSHREINFDRVNSRNRGHRPAHLGRPQLDLSCAWPAMPSIGATSRVKSRLILAVSTAASEVLVWASAVSTLAMAARLF